MSHPVGLLRPQPRVEDRTVPPAHRQVFKLVPAGHLRQDRVALSRLRRRAFLEGGEPPARRSQARGEQEAGPDAGPQAPRGQRRSCGQIQALLPDESAFGRAVPRHGDDGAVRPHCVRRGFADRGLRRNRRDGAWQAGRCRRRPAADAADQLLWQGNRRWLGKGSGGRGEHPCRMPRRGASEALPQLALPLPPRVVDRVLEPQLLRGRALFVPVGLRVQPPGRQVPLHQERRLWTRYQPERGPGRGGLCRPQGEVRVVQEAAEEHWHRHVQHAAAGGNRGHDRHALCARP